LKITYTIDEARAAGCCDACLAFKPDVKPPNQPHCAATPSVTGSRYCIKTGVSRAVTQWKERQKAGHQTPSAADMGI
jgi:hypothetical protein